MCSCVTSPGLSNCKGILMKTLNKTILALLLAPVFAQAAGEDIADQYFSKENPTLTTQEQAALSIAKRWETASPTGMKPVAGPDGSIRSFSEHNIPASSVLFCRFAMYLCKRANKSIPSTWVTPLAGKSSPRSPAQVPARSSTLLSSRWMWVWKLAW